jgi:imidazolonepropionase-like amidohydrolase
VIVAATRVSAEILGLESGTLAAGHVADFIVLPDDPLSDITATRRIAEVGRAGEYLDRDHLSSRFVGSMP